MNKKTVVGESMRELSHNELNEIYGGDDPTVSPRSTFICSGTIYSSRIILNDSNFYVKNNNKQ